MSSLNNQQKQLSNNNYQQFPYNLDNNSASLNESILQSNNKIDSNNNNNNNNSNNDGSLPIVEDSATLFTQNTYGENDVDMVQEIINDMIQKEDLNKDTNSISNDLENLNKTNEHEEDQNKKDTDELFLEQSILEGDVDVVVGSDIMSPVKNVDIPNETQLLLNNSSKDTSSIETNCLLNSTISPSTQSNIISNNNSNEKNCKQIENDNKENSILTSYQQFNDTLDRLNQSHESINNNNNSDKSNECNDALTDSASSLVKHNESIDSASIDLEEVNATSFTANTTLNSNETGQ